MAKPKIIDIDAEFEGIEFDETAIRRATGFKKRSGNPEWHKSRKETYSSSEYRKKRKEQFASVEVKQNIVAGRKKMIENTNWLENVTERNKQRSKDVNWIKNVSDANRKKAQDPGWIASRKKAAEKNKDPNSNYSKAIEKRTKSKEWQDKNSSKNKLLSSKQCITPYGIFWSRMDAGKYIFENNFQPTRKTLSSLMSWLISQFKNNPKEYYYITQEEYSFLTGKES